MFCCHGSNTPLSARKEQQRQGWKPSKRVDRQTSSSKNYEHVILSLQALTSHRQNRSSNVSFFVPYEESLNIRVIDEISRKVYKPNVCICMCVWCKLTNTMVRAQAAWRRRKLSHHCFISNNPFYFHSSTRRSWNKLLGRVCFHFWLWYFLAWSKGICYLQLCQLSTYSWFWLLKQT